MMIAECGLTVFAVSRLLMTWGSMKAKKMGFRLLSTRAGYWHGSINCIIKSKLVCGMFAVLQTCPFGQTMQNYQLSTNINKLFFICGLGGAHFFRTKKDRKQIRSCKASQDWKTRHPFRPNTARSQPIPPDISRKMLNLRGLGEKLTMSCSSSQQSNYSLLGAGGSAHSQLPAVNERYERWPCATIFEDDVRLAPNFTLRVSETVGSLPPFDARKKDPVVSAPAHNKTDGRVQHYQQSILDSSLVA